MIARASSAVCCGVSVWFDTGVILPSILMAGGKPGGDEQVGALLLRPSGAAGRA
jgi:hypothetical protein